MAPDPAEVIILKGVRLMCICGALPEEQLRRQPYEFDIEITADVSSATGSDLLADTVDYGEILNRVEAVALAESFQLFERMAQRVAEVILDDERIDSVTIEVRKLRPPVSQDLVSSGIRLTRSR